jgi:allantoate deiminase
MPIREDRILADIEAIASFSESPADVGYSRPTFSGPWRQARDYVIDHAKRAGCKVRIDAAGNVHARPETIAWDAPVWLSGSHIDSVPTGGKYDGIVGVVVPLEVLRAAHESGRNDLPLELMIFAEEEGTTFGLGMIGSRLWAATLKPSQVESLLNVNGQNWFAAGKSDGVDVDRLSSDRMVGGAYVGLIEVHVEQAARMWSDGARLGVVTSIAGRRQFRVVVDGEENHAGSTAMQDRNDALRGAVGLLNDLYQMPKCASADTVFTVGRVSVIPNAINVIPGRVEFTIDLRDPADAVLDEFENWIHATIDEHVRHRSLDATISRTEILPAFPMHRAVCDKLRAGLGAEGISARDVVSGALHDAAILAPFLPTAMLFIASKDGISHNPKEFSRIEDIATAARVLAKVVGL